MRDRTDASVTASYHGPGGPLFWLMVRTTIWNLLTLGLYRFWQRTLTRRHYWNGIRVQGSPLEYTGTGLEKFLGFTIAVVFLAVYLGVFQLAFFFVALRLSGGSEFVGLASSLPVLPLIFYAQYRARRYMLSRTQLRGIRFALSPDAWRYTGRALLLMVPVVLTLGLLWPRLHWHLEKFRSDRTTYGNLRLFQQGRWAPLIWPWLWVMATGILPYVALIGFTIADRPFAALASLVPFLFLPLALAHYSVRSFRIMTEGKSAGGLTFTSHARTGTVIAIHLLGWLLIAVISTVLITVLLAVSSLLTGEGLDTLAQVEDPGDLLQFVTFWVVAAGYLGFFLIFSALYAVFITQPVLAHFVATLDLHGVAELDLVRQREQDDFLEADGFADALDVGGGF